MTPAEPNRGSFGEENPCQDVKRRVHPAGGELQVIPLLRCSLHERIEATSFSSLLGFAMKLEQEKFRYCIEVLATLDREGDKFSKELMLDLPEKRQVPVQP